MPTATPSSCVPEHEMNLWEFQDMRFKTLGGEELNGIVARHTPTVRHDCQIMIGRKPPGLFKNGVVRRHSVYEA
jgi:hypothetical protein